MGKGLEGDCGLLKREGYPGNENAPMPMTFSSN